MTFPCNTLWENSIFMLKFFGLLGNEYIIIFYIYFLYSSLGSHMRFCTQAILCLLTIMIAAKSTKISINNFDNLGGEGGGGGGLEKNVKLAFLVGKIDV